MIGQTKLLNDLDGLIKEDKFPRFSIIVGPVGSGKHLICEHIAKSMDIFYCFEPDNKVDTVRRVITEAYKVTSPTIFIFSNADAMSAQAKNALLKVTEEPPNKAYFIVTLNDLSQTLATIKSRAQVFRVDPYTPTEIGEYANSVGIDNAEEMGILADICETPGEVDTLKASGIITFDEYMDIVVENIAEVSCANAFKISSKIRMKDEGEGYDLRLFLKAFMSKCAKKMSEDPMSRFKYAEAIKITSKYLQELNINGINKQSTFDVWMLDVRQALFDEE